MKISQRVFELLPGHEIMTDGQTDRQTDGQTDGQGDYYRAPPTSSSGALLTRDCSKAPSFSFVSYLKENHVIPYPDQQ